MLRRGSLLPLSLLYRHEHAAGNRPTGSASKCCRCQGSCRGRLHLILPSLSTDFQRRMCCCTHCKCARVMPLRHSFKNFDTARTAGEHAALRLLGCMHEFWGSRGARKRSDFSLLRIIGACSSLCCSVLSQAVADIVRTTLGPKSMLKMLLDPMGGIVITNDGNVSVLAALRIVRQRSCRCRLSCCVHSHPAARSWPT